MHLRILWVGKTKSLPIRSLLEDYLERIRHLAACEIIEMPDIAKRRRLRGDALLRAEAAQLSRFLTKGFPKVVLEERGRQFSSPAFARWLGREQTKGTRGLEFIVGGPEGLSGAIADDAYLKLALSTMTWTHEMCRVLLLEQIYRALTILRNIPYHK